MATGGSGKRPLQQDDDPRPRARLPRPTARGSPPMPELDEWTGYVSSEDSNDNEGHGDMPGSASGQPANPMPAPRSPSQPIHSSVAVPTTPAPTSRLREFPPRMPMPRMPPPSPEGPMPWQPTRPVGPPPGTTTGSQPPSPWAATPTGQSPWPQCPPGQPLSAPAPAGALAGMLAHVADPRHVAVGIVPHALEASAVAVFRMDADLHINLYAEALNRIPTHVVVPAWATMCEACGKKPSAQGLSECVPLSSTLNPHARRIAAPAVGCPTGAMASLVWPRRLRSDIGGGTCLNFHCRRKG